MMRQLRAVAAACGLVGLIALGAASWTRAQQPGPGAGEAAAPRQNNRERLVKLRTEVEVLQLGHDADRDDLFQAMTTVRKLRRDGLDRDDLKVIEDVVEGMQTVAAIVPEEEQAAKIKEIRQKLQGREVSRVDRYLVEKGLKEANYQEVGRLMVEDCVDARVKELRTSIEQKSADFTRRTAELNARKLELEDAERLYAGAR